MELHLVHLVRRASFAHRLLLVPSPLEAKQALLDLFPGGTFAAYPAVRVGHEHLIELRAEEIDRSWLELCTLVGVDMRRGHQLLEVLGKPLRTRFRFGAHSWH